MRDLAFAGIVCHFNLAIHARRNVPSHRPSARVVRRGVHNEAPTQHQLLVLQLSRDKEADTAVVSQSSFLWTAEQQLLRQQLERHELEVADAIPANHTALGARRPKDCWLQVCSALGLEVVERRAASHRVEDKAQGLFLCHNRARLAKAVLREKVSL